VVSNCKGQWTTSLVGIMLMSGLGNLQVGWNTMNDLLVLCDKIRAKGHPLARFNQVQRCAASAATECFEMCHLATLLITIVVREFGQ
jgi:hypothetical protein